MVLVRGTCACGRRDQVTMNPLFLNLETKFECNMESTRPRPPIKHLDKDYHYIFLLLNNYPSSLKFA